MKEKLWETMMFISRYPGGFYIMTTGLVITSLYYVYGTYAVSEMQLTHSSAFFQDAIRKLVIDLYQEKSLALLFLVLVTSYKKFAKDKKKFDRYG